MNKIRTITAMHTSQNDYTEYRFLRQDISRYYKATKISQASINRIRDLMYKNGQASVSLSGIWVDWFVRD